jgi:hypothetical protein
MSALHFPRSEINPWVTQYRGQIPIVRIRRALEEGQYMPPGGDNVLAFPTASTLPVLVRENETQFFGPVVNQILEIVESTVEPHSPSTRAGMRCSSLIDN